MRDGDADLGGSTVYLRAILGLSRVLCSLSFVFLAWGSCHWDLSDGLLRVGVGLAGHFNSPCPNSVWGC